MIVPKLTMSPGAGTSRLRFVGDRLFIELIAEEGAELLKAGFLRTNLTRAEVARAEVVARSGLRSEELVTFAGASWRDIPLTRSERGFAIDLPLLEVGHFRAKVYAIDARGRQHWPSGGDLGISVHPDRFRTANITYCTFPRLAGDSPKRQIPEHARSVVKELDARGFTVIPPSGTLRDLTRSLPHVFEQLGCQVLHLLPLGPVPTTFARMGRYGSPYAQLDLTAIDPAFVELDKRTTAIDQFRELCDAVHLYDGVVILDAVLNHVGWGAELWNERPEWFRRNPDGTFHSPGAWGVTWEDLVELDTTRPALWETLADALITWCERGVDGFRCDAGYMIPLSAWQYIVARVRQRFPECLFLLEGLGGAWEATERLITDGGMQWAYSELFQCYSPGEVARYLDHANYHSERSGLLVHYSETHDNDRLAKRGRAYSLLRNRLSALTSHAGTYAFTAGVEWLCTEKINVAEAYSLGIGNEPNLLTEIAALTRLLREHPCFFDGAVVERISPDESPVLALQRTSAEGKDACLVLANLDLARKQVITLPLAVWGSESRVELLGQELPTARALSATQVEVELDPAAAFCIGQTQAPRGLAGDCYREKRAQAAFGYAQLASVWPHEALGPVPFGELAELVARDPAAFLAATLLLDEQHTRLDLAGALRDALARIDYRPVVEISPDDAPRVTLIPPEHWLLIRDDAPFELEVRSEQGKTTMTRSIRVSGVHFAALAPDGGQSEQDLTLKIERFGSEVENVTMSARRLAHTPRVASTQREGLVLLTNGRGGMARLRIDLGYIESKYDCLLGANLHPSLPSDRHILAKRLRAWVIADGFLTALGESNLVHVAGGSPATWLFAANAGDGRRVGISLTASMLEGKNELRLSFARVPTGQRDLPAEREVRLTVRLDLEDRSFHGETHLDPNLEAAFVRATAARADRRGFRFQPSADRILDAVTDRGEYHCEVEWCRDIHHPFDEDRGFASRGDAYSPGWFELPLTVKDRVTLRVSAEFAASRASLVPVPSSQEHAPTDPAEPERRNELPPPEQAFEPTLRHAARQFVARRGAGRTVIAGYPWFLDWGRDSLIAARGLLKAGYREDVQGLVLTYAGLEQHGTLPNMLSAEGTVSRETSDAPLLLGLLIEELAAELGPLVYEQKAADGRTLHSVLVSIAEGLLRGAPNGVHVDVESALVFSPPHFTWMDTNYPAGTPREGYPIEIAALWVRLLRQLERLGAARQGESFAQLAARAQASLARFYRPELGYCADTLHAKPGVAARQAHGDDHLRPNQLLLVTLGFASQAVARNIVSAVGRHLLIPGALRSLAPLPVDFPLPITAGDGRLLNVPQHPYWARYEGDENTRRKPAYHNGTAWVFWLGAYCEALFQAYPRDPRAARAARAILGSTARLLSSECMGQLPEILDGDAPHQERGCDAQAWSVTETLRVWLALASGAPQRPSE